MANISGLLAGVIIGTALLLVSPSAHADPVADEMPAGFAGLYFGESIKSAKRKCVAFEVTSKPKAPKVHARCYIRGSFVSLIFSPNSKIEWIKMDISPETYAECAKHILNQMGLDGRFEDKDGNEGWAMGYTGERGEKLGGVVCQQREGESPFIAYMTE